MDFKEILDILQKGWLGGLALLVVLLRDTKLGDKIWALFVREREKTYTYEQMAIDTVKRTLETSAELPVKLSNLEYLIANHADLLEELLRSVRALSMESSINEKKLNQIIDLTTNLKEILENRKMIECPEIVKKGKK